MSTRRQSTRDAARGRESEKKCHRVLNAYFLVFFCVASLTLSLFCSLSFSLFLQHVFAKKSRTLFVANLSIGSIFIEFTLKWSYCATHIQNTHR